MTRFPCMQSRTNPGRVFVPTSTHPSRFQAQAGLIWENSKKTFSIVKRPICSDVATGENVRHSIIIRYYPLSSRSASPPCTGRLWLDSTIDRILIHQFVRWKEVCQITISLNFVHNSRQYTYGQVDDSRSSGVHLTIYKHSITSIWKFTSIFVVLPLENLEANVSSLLWKVLRSYMPHSWTCSVLLLANKWHQCCSPSVNEGNLGLGAAPHAKRKSCHQTVTMGTNTMKRSVARIKKRRSIEKLMEDDANLRRIVIPREKGGFGFNLRGMSGDKGAKHNRYCNIVNVAVHLVNILPRTEPISCQWFVSKLS